MDSFWDFFWLMITTFLFIGYLVVLMQIVGDLFRDRSVSGGAKAIWIFCLLFFPMITALVYLITRGDGMAERTRDSFSQSVGSSASPAEEITKAKTLLDAGTISQEEYDALKAKALA